MGTNPHLWCPLRVLSYWLTSPKLQESLCWVWSWFCPPGAVVWNQSSARIFICPLVASHSLSCFSWQCLSPWDRAVFRHRWHCSQSHVPWAHVDPCKAFCVPLPWQGSVLSRSFVAMLSEILSYGQIFCSFSCSPRMFSLNTLFSTVHTL